MIAIQIALVTDFGERFREDSEQILGSLSLGV